MDVKSSEPGAAGHHHPTNKSDRLWRAMRPLGLFGNESHPYLAQSTRYFQLVARKIDQPVFRVKQFFATLPRNLIGCFKGRMILWHIAAIVLTAILVLSGFDWFYFCSTRGPLLRQWMFPAAPIGGLVPLVLPLVLIVSCFIISRARLSLTGWAIGQAELIGSIISSAYKAFTGRVHPAMHETGADISHVVPFRTSARRCVSGAGRRRIPPSPSPWRPQFTRSCRSNGGWVGWPLPTPFTSALAFP